MTTQTTTPTLVHTRGALAAALAVQDVQAVPRTEGRSGTAHSARPYRRAVVMTMGALHAGHLSLVARARELADAVVVTIFVNPLQFAPTEDLARYPRDLERDLALLSGPGLLGPDDIVFAPGPEVVYPDGDPVVRVRAGAIGEVLEGASRPGHLDGVLTVVLKLLHLTRPEVALFGAKDAQQLAAVRRMVRDLDVPVTVEAAPIVRDDDGLALSSRNAYLSDDERRRALGLSRAVRATGSAERIRATAHRELADLDVDYVALVDPETFAEVPADFVGEALLLVAATVGTTRLIDNARVEVGA
jgi:pantoate--beta-alanine ligase